MTCWKYCRSRREFVTGTAALSRRRFEQVINNQHYWFIETAPGEFRRADAPPPPAEVRDLPDWTAPMGPEKKDPDEEKKPDETRGDRPV